jgi:aryl-alcohol dehydrogenase-like predicted oxidoreductase
VLTATFPGLEGAASRLVMGTVRADPPLWDAFVEAGGSCFDTARHYGDASEAPLGRLLERRGIRDRVVLVGKVAHTPECRPAAVGPQLSRSLELLRTDHLDLLLVHRDDPAVPVGEFVEALDAEVRAGRARAVGVSNWTPARCEAFEVYAHAHGRARLACVSTQLSLPEMREPVWEGCVRADPTWHEHTGTPLLAWSAQGRGYLSGRADDVPEVRRCWASPVNEARREEATRIAAALGVTAAAVGLAWLLARPFPVWAVIGPRGREELAACLAALDVPAAALEALA